MGRIVVIEEDLLVRAMLQCALPDGVEPSFPGDEEAALAALTELRPQSIIIGHTTGKLSAGALCRRLRAQVAGERVPIILMDERYRDDALARTETQAYDADAYIPLPFNRGDVDAALTSARERFAERSGKREQSLTGSYAAIAVEIEAATPAETEAEQAAFSWTAFEDRVKRIFRNLDRLDHYQVLEITPYASPAQVKDAYYGRSLEFHPDRFAQLEDREIHEKIYQIYKRVSEAFRVLSDADRRSQYDHEVAGTRRLRAETVQKKLRLGVTLAAKRYLGEALRAEREGDLEGAKSYLLLAHEAAPTNHDIKRKLDEILARLGEAG
ncbi:MAG TPA: DnaJ domain-containing protein [Polyangia bacterium]